MTKMKYLITGSSGFIGSNLVNKLLENDENYVIGVDSNDFPFQDSVDYSNFKNKKISLLDFCENAEIKLSEYTVFHLAAVKNHKSEDREELNKTNISATDSFFKLCKNAGVKKIFFSSSLYVYGTKSTQDFTESSTLSPETVYGKSKVEGEKIFNKYFKLEDNLSVCLRLFFIYGPNQSNLSSNYKTVIHKNVENSIKNEKFTINGDGNQIMDYLYIDDLIQIFLLLSDLPNGNYLFNASSGYGHSVNEIVNTIKKVTKSKSEIEFLPEDFTHNTRRVGDNRLIKKYINWAPSVKLEEGIQKIYEQKL